ALRGVIGDVPDNPVALATLRRFLIEGERWSDAVEVLAREIQVTRDRPTEIARRLDRASLLRDHVKDDAGAIAELEAVRALDPGDVAALGGLEALYAKKGDAEALARTLDEMARVERDPEHAADLLARAGAVLAKAGKLEVAADALERALLRAPSRTESLD